MSGFRGTARGPAILRWIQPCVFFHIPWCFAVLFLLIIITVSFAGLLLLRNTGNELPVPPVVSGSWVRCSARGRCSSPSRCPASWTRNLAPPFVCQPAIDVCKSLSASTFYFFFHQFFTDTHVFSINQCPCQCADPAGITAICITGVFNPCLNPG